MSCYDPMLHSSNINRGFINKYGEYVYVRVYIDIFCDKICVNEDRYKCISVR